MQASQGIDGGGIVQRSASLRDAAMHMQQAPGFGKQDLPAPVHPPLGACHMATGLTNQASMHRCWPRMRVRIEGDAHGLDPHVCHDLTTVRMCIEILFVKPRGLFDQAGGGFRKRAGLYLVRRLAA